MIAAERWRELHRLEDWLTLPMLALTLVWLAIFILELTGQANSFLLGIGTTIWIVFILEFAIRFTLAPGKLKFLKRNWLTVIALALPALRLFRFLRIVKAAKALRGLRLIRVVGTVNRGMNSLRAGLRRRGFNYVFSLTALVLFVGAAGMMNLEPAESVEGGFRSYGEALWWTGMLIASLGTDFWPQTAEGRALSTFLALYGLAVFGYITATFATFFLGKDAKGAPTDQNQCINELKEEVAALRALLEQHQVHPRT